MHKINKQKISKINKDLNPKVYLIKMSIIEIQLFKGLLIITNKIIKEVT